MSDIKKEMKSLKSSSGRKYIEERLLSRKKQLLDEMMSQCKIVNLVQDNMEEYARKKLYAQHLLQVQYHFVEYLLSIPDVAMNVVDNENKPLDAFLSEFDSQYTDKL